MSITIPEKMKAIVLTGPGQHELQEIPVPKPGPFEVLSKVRAVAICGSDPEIFAGGLTGFWPPSYPFIAGHEWAGEVVAIGEGVTDLKPGDRVAGEPHKGCGFCENCKAGRYTLCMNYGKPESGHRHYGFISPGAYAQYAVHANRTLTKMPVHVTFAEGSMCDTAAVSLHGLELTGITPGGYVVIIGPGPIGLLAMRLAKSMGAAKVIMVGRKSRLEAAKRLGADAVVDFEKEEPIEAVRAITSGRGVDEAFESSGAAGTLIQAIRMVKKGGKVSLLGVPSDKVQEPIPFKYIVHNEIMIIGSRADPNTMWRAMGMIASGSLNVKDLITHQFPIESYTEALDVFINRKENAVKVIIEPNGKES
jgi:L-iditol 2-dehydrogenase